MDKPDEKISSYVTSSAEEDLLVVGGAPASPDISVYRWLSVIILSVMVLVAYFTLNVKLFPAYPVLNTFAENNDTYAANYPPFRLNEYANYQLTEALITGDRSVFTGKPDRPVGFSLLAVPFTMKFGEIGMYYTNAVLMWACMLVFFLVMVQVTKFSAAIAFSALLAFATPNLFFAASAYGESLSQLLLLLSVLFLVRGLSSYRESIHYALCGFTIGLQLFAQPYMLVSVVVFIAVIFAERSFKTWKDSGLLALVGGVAAAMVFHAVVYRIAIGRFPGGVFSLAWWLPVNIYKEAAAGGCNPVLTFWNYLFDSPQGLLFIMPVVMLSPLGIIIMWRDMYRSHAIVAGAVSLYAIIVASFCGLAAGESMGGRLLLPVMPLIIMPLAFVWEQEIGEKIWLAVTLVFTIYMSTFGWWMGPVGQRDLFGGLLQDRDARTIMLARKGMIEQPVFRSRSEIVGQFNQSLRDRDIRKWIETLSPATILAVRGFERIVFTTVSDHIINGDAQPDDYIESVDPDGGIMLVLPNIGESGDTRFLPIRAE